MYLKSVLVVGCLCNGIDQLLIHIVIHYYRLFIYPIISFLSRRLGNIVTVFPRLRNEKQVKDDEMFMYVNLS